MIAGNGNGNLYFCKRCRANFDAQDVPGVAVANFPDTAILFLLA